MPARKPPIRAPQRWRDRARLPADVERLAALVLDDFDHACIASEAPSGLDRCGGTVLELATTGGAVLERAFVDVQHDLVTVAAAQRFGAVLQEALGQHHQRIGAPRGRSRLPINDGKRRFS